MNMRSKMLLAAVVALFGIGSVVSVSTVSAQTKKKKPAPIAKGNAEKGKKIFLESGCLACHKAEGKGGVTGPDLSGIGKNAKWTDAKMTAVIRDPKKVLKSEKMPAYPVDKISAKDLADLLAYTHTLKQ